MQLHKRNHCCLDRKEIREFPGACSCWSHLIPVRVRLASTKVAGVPHYPLFASTLIIIFSCSERFSAMGTDSKF